MSVPSVLGNNSSFGYNVTGSGSYTTVSNLKSINVPDPEITQVNVSGLGDTVDVFAQGFLDNKEFSIELFHTSANFTLATATFASISASQPGTYQITLSDSHTFTFLAWFKGYKAKVDRNAAVVYELSFKITGAVTYS